MPLLKPTRGILLNKSHPLARDLVGCWLLNEGTGSKVSDLSRRGINLDSYNSPVWSPGNYGHSILFDDGSNQYLQTDKCPVSAGDDITMLAWFNVDDLNMRQAIIQVTDKDTANNYDLLYFYEATNKIRAATYGSLFAYAEATKACIVNKWYQGVAVFKGNDYRAIYLDSGNKAEDSTAVTLSGLDRTAIGGARDSTPSFYVSGKIGLAMIWNRALSAAEIARLYREPFCMFERAIRPGLISGPIVNLAGASTALSSLSATAKAIRKVGGTVVGTSDVAALLNLIRGEESSLDIERNWLREALVDGMTASAFKLGTTLSLGWFWVCVAGCSVLYRGPSMERIDFTSLLTVAEQNACEISPPSYIPHSSSSIYFYVIRRFSSCGYQELTLAAAAKVSIDASGELEKPEPNNIFGSKADQVDGNKIQLVWFYCPLEQKSRPVYFNVYYDGGMGQIDYENPLAKISYEGRRFYSYQSGALDAGGYLFTIRAEDTDGIENSSSAQLKIQLDTTSPDAIYILRTETV
jgi:hypothetical protein